MCGTNGLVLGMHAGRQQFWTAKDEKSERFRQPINDVPQKVNWTVANYMVIAATWASPIIYRCPISAYLRVCYHSRQQESLQGEQLVSCDASGTVAVMDEVGGTDECS